MKGTTTPTVVLYGDYNNHLRPLSQMYFSLDSRCLVADHPQSVQEEVESHFCPHCFSLFTTPDAMSTENRCPQCFECPCCRCVLVPSPVSLEKASSPSSAGPSLYCLRCLYCQWTSEDSGLIASDPVSLAEATETMAREDNGGGGKGSKGGKGGGSVIGALLNAAKQREAEAMRVAAAVVDSRGGRVVGGVLGVGSVNIARSGSAIARVPRVASPFSAASAAASATGPWKVADIEEAVKRRNQVVTAASRSPAAPHRAATVQEPSPRASPLLPSSLEGDADGPDPTLWTLTSRHETTGLTERSEPSSPWVARGGEMRLPLVSDGGSRGALAASEASSSTGAQTGGGGGVAQWCPQRVRLRTRLGKRCRKDLAAGRAGILIKATFNPLEGDSSTAKKGVKKKWFKKDCSAALLVPRITVAALPSSVALLGATIKTSQQSGAQQDGGGDAGDESGETSSSPRDRQGPKQRHPPSLVLRVANPQQDTPVRLRVAAAAADGPATTDSTAEDTSRTLEGLPPPPAGTTTSAAVAAPGTVRVVTVRPSGWKEGDLVKLEGKEDEVLRQPGDRHRLPDGVLLLTGQGTTGRGDLDDGGSKGASATAVAAPFLVHQQGDVAWVGLPFDELSVDRVAAAAAAATNELEESLVVDVRFSLVMGEGEEEGGGEGQRGEGGSAGEDVSIPISVRFPLSECPAR